jgi:hypothetical protein
LFVNDISTVPHVAKVVPDTVVPWSACVVGLFVIWSGIRRPLSEDKGRVQATNVPLLFDLLLTHIFATPHDHISKLGLVIFASAFESSFVLSLLMIILVKISFSLKVQVILFSNFLHNTEEAYRFVDIDRLVTSNIEVSDCFG